LCSSRVRGRAEHFAAEECPDRLIVSVRPTPEAYHLARAAAQ